MDLLQNENVRVNNPITIKKSDFTKPIQEHIINNAMGININPTINSLANTMQSVSQQPQQQTNNNTELLNEILNDPDVMRVYMQKKGLIPNEQSQATSAIQQQSQTQDQQNDVAGDDPLQSLLSEYIMNDNQNESQSMNQQQASQQQQEQQSSLNQSQQQAVNQAQQSMNQQQAKQNESPQNDVVMSVSQLALKEGLDPKDVLEFATQITPEAIVEMYKAFKEDNQEQPSPTTIAQMNTPPIQQSSGSVFRSVKNTVFD